MLILAKAAAKLILCYPTYIPLCINVFLSAVRNALGISLKSFLINPLK